MQRLLIPVFCCAVICSCNNNAPKTADNNPPAKNEAAAANNPTATPHPAIGNWVGFLGDNKVNISIQEVAGNTIAGKSIAAGNYRDIKGTIEDKGSEYVIHMTEPGDDKYDGVFDFSIKKEGWVCSGKWVPNDKTLQTKLFTCSKKDFVYKPDVGIYTDASEKLLKTEDVSDLIKSDLRLMRNAIYARHGYSFKMKDMRTQFDTEDWYIPVSTDVRTVLTDIEKKNEALIKRYEKYAAEYYDDFGR